VFFALPPLHEGEFWTSSHTVQLFEFLRECTITYSILHGSVNLAFFLEPSIPDEKHGFEGHKDRAVIVPE